MSDLWFELFKRIDRTEQELQKIPIPNPIPLSTTVQIIQTKYVFRHKTTNYLIPLLTYEITEMQHYWNMTSLKCYTAEIGQH